MFKKKLNKWLYEKTRNLLRMQAKVKPYTVEVEGHSIAYLESKKEGKNTLILIHGLNDEKETWLMMAAALKGKYHLIIIDLLGCGESALPMDFEYTLRNQVDFLEKIIRKLMEEKKIQRFSLAGHSMGGGLVVLLADRLSIEKLILVDAMGIHVKLTSMQIEAQKVGDAEELPFLNLHNKEQLKSAMKTSMYKPLYMPNFMLEYILVKKAELVEFERKKFHAIVDENMLHRDELEAEIKSIKQETLIVWGKEDLGIDVSSAYKMHELTVHSTLRIYEECRHYPQVEKPKELAKDIIEFLK